MIGVLGTCDNRSHGGRDAACDLSAMTRLDPSPWNLATTTARAVPLLLIAGCGPVVLQPGETDGETESSSDSDPSNPSDPSSPSDPTANTTVNTTSPSDPSDPSDPTQDHGCYDDYACPQGYACDPVSGECYPDYCLDGCCDEGGGSGGDCCYYDGCWDYCYYDIDCGPGNICDDEFSDCSVAEQPPVCDGEVLTQIIPIAIGSEVSSLAFVDANGDAARELAVGHVAGVSLVPGANVGAPVAVGVTPDAPTLDVAAGDLDGDGDADLVVAYGGASPGIGTYASSGGSAFTFAAGIDGTAARIGVADFDADGIGDIAGVFDFGAPTPELAIVRGLGGGDYDAPYVHSTAAPVYDFDAAPLLGGPGDDLVAFDTDTVAMWHSGPLDGAVDQYIWGGGYNEGSVALGDFGGAGGNDLVRVIAYGGGTLVHYYDGGKGSLFVDRKLWVQGEYSSAAAGDVDGDGRVDLVLGSPVGGFVVLRTLSASYDACIQYVDAGPAYRHAIGDFTGDGRADVALVDGNDAVVYATP